MDPYVSGGVVAITRSNDRRGGWPLDSGHAPRFGLLWLLPVWVRSRSLLRSILGVGAGSVSPIAFGMALDMTPASVSWGLAFCTLAFDGALAFACAIALRK